MSIWCSWEHIGTDPQPWANAETGEPIEQKPERGNVLSYALGWSNHYPDLTGEAERPAVIALAHMPEWCVPGHDESGDYDVNGPWLRLEVAAPETLNFWTKDGENPTVEQDGATVVMDEEAVRSLRDDLTRWLERPKAHPVSDKATS